MQACGAASLNFQQLAQSRGSESPPQKLMKKSTTQHIRQRLARQDTKHSLVAQCADDSRVLLDDFASQATPTYNAWHAVAFAGLIDWIILFRLPVGGKFIRSIVRCGGSEQIRFLFALAQFDSDGNGRISHDEWLEYEKLADPLIGDAVIQCGNLALVGALLLGLTHQVTIGRPVPWQLSEASAGFFGRYDDPLLYASFGFNCAAECAAFFTLTIAVITRHCLTSIMPTRELKLDLLRTTNALGIMSVSLLVTLWCFIFSGVLGVVVASPTFGFLGLGLFAMLFVACLWLIGPIRYTSILLLHTEVRRAMHARGGTFRGSARGRGASGSIGMSVSGSNRGSHASGSLNSNLSGSEGEEAAEVAGCAVSPEASTASRRKVSIQDPGDVQQQLRDLEA